MSTLGGNLTLFVLVLDYLQSPNVGLKSYLLFWVHAMKPASATSLSTFLTTPVSHR